MRGGGFRRAEHAPDGRSQTHDLHAQSDVRRIGEVSDAQKYHEVSDRRSMCGTGGTRRAQTTYPGGGGIKSVEYTYVRPAKYARDRRDQTRGLLHARGKQTRGKICSAESI